MRRARARAAAGRRRPLGTFRREAAGIAVDLAARRRLALAHARQFGDMPVTDRAAADAERVFAHGVDRDRRTARHGCSPAPSGSAGRRHDDRTARPRASVRASRRPDGYADIWGQRHDAVRDEPGRAAGRARRRRRQRRGRIGAAERRDDERGRAAGLPPRRRDRRRRTILDESPAVGHGRPARSRLGPLILEDGSRRAAAKRMAIPLATARVPLRVIDEPLPTGYHRIAIDGRPTRDAGRRRTRRPASSRPRCEGGTRLGPGAPALRAALAAQLGHRRFRRPADASSTSGRRAAPAWSASIRCTRCSPTTRCTSAPTARRRGCSSTRCTSTSTRVADLAECEEAQCAGRLGRIPAAAGRAARERAGALCRGRGREDAGAAPAARALRRAPPRSRQRPRGAAYRRFRRRARRAVAAACAASRRCRAIPPRRRPGGLGLAGLARGVIARRDAPAVAAFAAEHADEVDFFCYLQWLADEQLAAAQQRCVERGMAIGLYLDLAVSVDRAGSDAWAHAADYARRRDHRRAARRGQPERPGLGPAAAASGPHARARPRALHRDAARRDAPRRRAAHRPRDGPDAPVLDSARPARRRRRLRALSARRAGRRSSRSRASAIAAW